MAGDEAGGIHGGRSWRSRGALSEMPEFGLYRVVEGSPMRLIVLSNCRFITV